MAESRIKADLRYGENVTAQFADRIGGLEAYVNGRTLSIWDERSFKHVDIEYLGFTPAELDRALSVAKRMLLGDASSAIMVPSFKALTNYVVPDPDAQA